MNATWVVDTEPNERFTLYTCGNVGEEFPHVITPPTGTLIGDVVRQAQSDLFVEMCSVVARSRALRPRPASRRVCVLTSILSSSILFLV